MCLNLPQTHLSSSPVTDVVVLASRRVYAFALRRRLGTRVFSVVVYIVLAALAFAFVMKFAAGGGEGKLSHTLRVKQNIH